MHPRPAEILVVEDNEMDFELLELSFRRLPFQKNFHQVDDGESAWELLHQSGEFTDAPRPDLILLDLNLPGMSGHEVLAKIKDDENLKTIPVLILTTSSYAQDILKAYQNMANGYVTKDFGFQVVKSLSKLTEFWFSLVRLPSGKTIPPESRKEEEQVEEVFLHSKVHILFIEDDPLEIELMQEAAEALDLRSPLEIVSNAEEALDILHKETHDSKPDLILLDLNMPDMDGLSMLRKLRQDDATKLLQIVMYSSSEEDDKVLESYRRYVNAFVPRPKNLEETLSVLETITQWYSISRMANI